MSRPAMDLPAVDERCIATSPLRGRTVIVVDRSAGGAGRSLLDALDRRTEVSAARCSGVYEHGLPRIFGNHLATQDAGLGLLLPLGALVAAGRRLVDDLLDACGGDGLLVELVPGAAVPEALVRSLHPDAAIVTVTDAPSGPGDLRAADVQRAPAEAAATVVASVLRDDDLARRRRSETADPTDPADPADADALRGRLLVLFGVPRSGTTWVEQLLLAHPQTAGIPEGESWLFRAVQGLWENQEHALGLHEVVDRAQLAVALRHFCDRVLGHQLAGTDATHVVEKTPANAWLLPWIRAVYPDAWFLHVVRDGRDVARSGSTMDHGTPDVRAVAAHWAATLREVDTRHWALGRFREVRYEDVVADPVGAAVGVLAWAGIPSDSAAASAIAGAAAVRVSRHGTTGPVGPGKWTAMDRVDARSVLAAAGDELVARGYVAPDEVRAAVRRSRRPSGLLAEARRRARLRGATSRPRARASSG